MPSSSKVEHARRPERAIARSHACVTIDLDVQGHTNLPTNRKLLRPLRAQPATSRKRA
jgi:hypothetical protein